MKKVALILMPGVPRLAPHVGAQEAWFELSEKSLLPRPHLIIGCSAGAAAGATCQPWTKTNFKITAEVFKNLKTGQVSSMPWWTEALAAITLGATLMPVANLDDGRSKKEKTLIRLGEVVLTLGLGALFVYRFFNKEFIVSNDPLRRLLMGKLDFPGIFKSDIKLEILATDLENGTEVVFTNYRPEDQHPERFVEAILASSRLAGRMPPVCIDGKVLGDAGILNNIPIHRAIENNCDAVVIFAYTKLEPEYKKAPWNWPLDLIRCSDITEAATTKLTLANYDLEKKLGRKLPEIFIVTSQERLPSVNFRSFSQTTMTAGMDIGWRAIHDNLSKLVEICT